MRRMNFLMKIYVFWDKTTITDVTEDISVSILRGKNSEKNVTNQHSVILQKTLMCLF